MFWLPLLIIGIIVIILEFVLNHNWIRTTIVITTVALLTGLIVVMDLESQTTDYEVWSGTVVDWSHEEEWDQWIPPSTTCTTNANGVQSCTTRPGYMIHHSAENSIKTSDDGWISVDESPDGKEFNDSWPNDVKPLQSYWPKGTPSASKHRYVNKVNASYSVYRHPDVDLNDYPDLPEYPLTVRDHLFIDRILGDVPNKKEALVLLAKENTRLNKMVPDPENPEKMRSWKQANIIFVNLGPGKDEKHGFALQDSWQGGNKNDFVVSFSMEKDGTLNWVYPFSWSESELLKLEVRDYLMDQGKITDFAPVVTDIGKLVEEKFERKEFADFNYLQVDVSKGAITGIWIFALLALGVNIFLAFQEKNGFTYSNRRSFY